MSGIQPQQQTCLLKSLPFPILDKCNHPGLKTSAGRRAFRVGPGIVYETLLKGGRAWVKGLFIYFVVF